jgi:hypothetical protein
MSSLDSGQVRFTINGHHYNLSREQVEKALAGVEPEPTKLHAVQIGRHMFPVKQALSQATGLDRLDFQSTDARRVFRRLGFKLLRAAE